VNKIERPLQGVSGAKRQASDILMEQIKKIHTRRAEILSELSYLQNELGKLEPALYMLGIYPTAAKGMEVKGLDDLPPAP